MQGNHAKWAASEAWSHRGVAHAAPEHAEASVTERVGVPVARPVIWRRHGMIREFPGAIADSTNEPAGVSGWTASPLLVAILLPVRLLPLSGISRFHIRIDRLQQRVIVP